MKRIINQFVRIRHVIFYKFLQYVIYKERGFARNQFGSIISPLEQRISWDEKLQDRALELRGFFHEAMLSSHPEKQLVRVGSINDGGYYLPKNLAEIDGVISGGIGLDNNFEIALGEMHLKVMQFDASIERPPQLHPNLRFSRNYMNSNEITLNKALDIFKAQFSKSLQNGLLKLDIEGSEWDLFSITDDNAENLIALSKFAILSIEFHDLGKIHLDDFWYKVKNTLNLISSRFEPILVSGNNCREFVQMGGVPILDTFEVTYVRRVNDFSVSKMEKKFMTENIIGRSSLYSQAFTS